jgi:hypothetical protein
VGGGGERWGKPTFPTPKFSRKAPIYVLSSAVTYGPIVKQTAKRG